MKVMRETGQWRWQVYTSTENPGEETRWFHNRTFRADDRDAADHLVLALIHAGYGAKIIDKMTGEEG